MPSSSSTASNDSREKPASETSARSRDTLVPAFYAAMLLALLAVAAYGEAVHPLLAAALGVGLVFCWISWPAYRESVER